MSELTVDHAFRVMWWETWPIAFASAIEMAASGPDDITRWRRRREWERLVAQVKAELLATAIEVFQHTQGIQEVRLDGCVAPTEVVCTCPDPLGWCKAHPRSDLT